MPLKGANINQDMGQRNNLHVLVTRAGRKISNETDSPRRNGDRAKNHVILQKNPIEIIDVQSLHNHNYIQNCTREGESQSVKGESGVT